MEQPELGTVRQLGVPVKMSRTPGDPTRPAPAFGEHTDEVLREAGYNDEEIAAMMASGAAVGSQMTEQVAAGPHMAEAEGRSHGRN